ncbi:alpha/beta hydrolase family protein [Gordonia phthalatica]|uniref:BD-FAE-like domain-containing protein n=1 Tax=Gordonia phthalatica TaxID=1136941 RepID=A0A0N9MSR3_9ACTN|nr:alpha/beta fold hydrolase [Gordonia phthalatica]ALG86152.1 hypothetical protein ACH46_18710 [Gordonia phthalatica]
MTLTRPHPLLTATLSTVLVALACAVVLVWGTVTPGSHPAAHSSHTAMVVPAAHHDRSVNGDVVRRIHYPAHDADPNQNYADLFLPADYTHRSAIPLVALVHGGSWARGVTAQSFDRLAHDLTARGIAVYNVEYRRVGTGGGWPTTFTDVGNALDDLPTVAANYPQIDLATSVLVGHSAGAQLAAWAGLRTAAAPGPGLGAPRWIPRRVVSISGPLDMTWSATHGDSRVVRVLQGTPSRVAAHYRLVDPLTLIDHRNDAVGPDFVVLHGTADHVVSPRDSIRFVVDYLTHGGHARLNLLPGQTHTSMFRSGSTAYRDLIRTIVDAAK